MPFPFFDGNKQLDGIQGGLLSSFTAVIWGETAVSRLQALVLINYTVNLNKLH